MIILEAIIIAVIISTLISFVMGTVIGRAAQRAVITTSRENICGCTHHKSYHKNWSVRTWNGNCYVNLSGACTYNLKANGSGCRCQEFVPDGNDLARLEELLRPELPDLEAIEREENVSKSTSRRKHA